jgi:hypothetical protein
MTIRIRTVSTIALALVGAFGLAACTATEPPPKDAFDSLTSSPNEALTVVSEADEQAASLATSIALFDESAVVVVAPDGDAEAQALAARASVALGVPLLISGPADNADPGDSADDSAENPSTEGDVAVATALSDEFTRLKATTVFAIGAPAGFPAEGEDGDESDNDSSGTGAAGGSVEDPRIIAAEATPDALEDALGFALADRASDAPADTPTEAPTEGVSALTSETAALSPTSAQDRAASGTGDGDIPLTNPAPAIEDTLALVLDADAQVASIATARAAGVAVQLLATSTPNPQASDAAIDALHQSPTSKTLAIGAGFAGETQLDWKIRAARTGETLPGGGQLLFPQHQFIALYGTPGTPSMGVLGEQDVTAAIQRAKDVAAPYVGLTDKTVVPMFEIITTVAAASAGSDGNYSNELDAATIRPWIDAAAAEGVYVVLDLQPGRTDFLTQAKQYEELLLLPDVGLAIDPEWRLGPNEVHLTQIGGVDAAEVNAVTAWLAELTNENALPQKMLVLHQFRLSMLRDRSTIDMSHPELAMLIHADGLGAQPDKQATWRALHQDAPAGIAWGWKNFYDEDAPMLDPGQTIRDVSPVPDLVTYQ